MQEIVFKHRIFYYVRYCMNTRISILEKQSIEAPESAVIWEELGDLYSQAGDWEKAIEAYDFVLAIKPDNLEVSRKRILVLLAGDNEHNIRVAISELEGYCQRNPTDKEMHTLRVLFLLNDTEFSFADEFLQENNPDYYLGELEHNFQMKDVPQMIYLNLINSYISLKQFQRAIYLLDIFSQWHPDDYLLYIAYGSVYLHTGQTDEAKNMFDKAYYYTNDINDRDVCFLQIGLSYFHVENYKMAYFYLNKMELEVNKKETIPYLACCCLENGGEEEYFYYIDQFTEIPFFCIKNAFKNHIPKNITPQELIPFLKKLYHRYNF